MLNRAQKSKVWSEGYSAGKTGKPRASNPYLGGEPALAKEWDLGWQEGTGFQG
ncbi:MAG: ribosome modulation factor [Neptuniibacter sp.]